MKKRVTISSFLSQSRGATKSTRGQSIVTVESIRPGRAREFGLLTEHMHPQLFRTLALDVQTTQQHQKKGDLLRLSFTECRHDALTLLDSSFAKVFRQDCQLASLNY